MNGLPMSSIPGLLAIAVGIIAVFWMFRDARARAFYPILWTVPFALIYFTLHLFSPLAGVVLFLYLIFRPKGKILPCPHCGARHLESLAMCPKCEGPVRRDCPHCQASAHYHDSKCPECGGQL